MKFGQASNFWFFEQRHQKDEGPVEAVMSIAKTSNRCQVPHTKSLSQVVSIASYHLFLM